MELKWGTTRLVLLTNRWALKFPAITEWRLFLHGLLANMQEATFSKTRHLKLCPVKFSVPGGFLVVMPRAEELSRDEFYSLDVGSFVHSGDLAVPVENKLSSFGKYRGRVVATDYGS